MFSKGVRLLRIDELKEILEIEGYNYLLALQKSESFNGFDHPDVYILKGTLIGISKVTGIDFEVEKDYKIKFFKKLTESSFMRGNDRGKFWFQIQLDMTEEEADERIEAKKRAIREEMAMRKRFLG